MKVEYQSFQSCSCTIGNEFFAMGRNEFIKECNVLNYTLTEFWIAAIILPVFNDIRLSFGKVLKK